MTSATTSKFTVIPVPGHGAEDVVVGLSGADMGSVFTGTDDGSIFRISPDGSKVDRVANTGGRPLGLELGPDGRLLVCDSDLGLLWVDTASGAVEAITDSLGGARMKLLDNATIQSDGTIWFSDSSTQYGLDRWMHDVVQNTRTGRLGRMAPDGTTEVVLDGLAFANGVVLSKDEDFVLVAESGARAVVRRWLTGNRAGMRDLFCQNLPGYPDNLSLGSDGLIWMAVASPTNPLLARLHRSPRAVRKLVTAIPARLQPKPARSVRVRAYDNDGKLVHDIDVHPNEHGGAFHMVTGVREHEGRVWMGSVDEPAVAVYTL